MSVYGYCRISTPQQNIERQAHRPRCLYRNGLPRTAGAGQAAALCTVRGYHRV